MAKLGVLPVDTFVRSFKCFLRPYSVPGPVLALGNYHEQDRDFVLDECVKRELE